MSYMMFLCLQNQYTFVNTCTFFQISSRYFQFDTINLNQFELQIIAHP
jgi:hypothetical protein